MADEWAKAVPNASYLPTVGRMAIYRAELHTSALEVLEHIAVWAWLFCACTHSALLLLPAVLHLL